MTSGPALCDVGPHKIGSKIDATLQARFDCHTNSSDNDSESDMKTKADDPDP